jgi:hypothetical protein
MGWRDKGRSTDFRFALGEKAMSVIHQDMAAAEDPDLVTVDDGNSIQGSALSLLFWIIACLVSLSDILRCWTEGQGPFWARGCWWVKFVEAVSEQTCCRATTIVCELDPPNMSSRNLCCSTARRHRVRIPREGRTLFQDPRTQRVTKLIGQPAIGGGRGSLIHTIKRPGKDQTKSRER